MFIAETQATILGIWETGIACLIFLLLPASLKEKLPVQSLGPISAFKDKGLKSMDLHLNDTARNRIEHLAGVFDELSSTFMDKTGTAYEYGDSAYLAYLYDEISTNFCRSCSRYEDCWGRNCYTTSQEILDIFSIAESSEKLTMKIARLVSAATASMAGKCWGLLTTFDNLRINEYWIGRLQESAVWYHGSCRISRVMKTWRKKLMLVP